MVEILQETILTLDLPYQEQMKLERTVFQGGAGPKVAVIS